MDGKNDGFSTEIAKHASLSSSGYNSVVSEILERAKEKYPAAKLRTSPTTGRSASHVISRSSFASRARPNFAVPSPIERESRALAQRLK